MCVCGGGSILTADNSMHTQAKPNCVLSTSQSLVQDRKTALIVVTSVEVPTFPLKG